MKFTIKRLMSLILVVVMLVPILASCGLLELFGKDPDITTAGPTTPPTTTEPIPVFDRVPIEGLSEYVIVYPEIASDSLYEAVLALRDAIKDVTGIELAVVSDLVEIGEAVPVGTKEILVGATNRYESAGTPSLRYDDYYVAFENSRLALMGGSEDAVIEAVGFAIDYLLADGSLGYADGGYHYAATYPLSAMTLAGRSIADFVIVRDGENATLAAYLAECIRKATGFVLPIRTAEDPEVAYEILIGNTGRNATSTVLTEKKYIIDVVGTKLVLYGTGENAAYYATLRFINKYLDKQLSVLAVEREEFDNSAAGIYHLNIPATLDTITLEYQENSGGVLERFLKAKDELPEEITVIEPVTLAQYPFSIRRSEVYISPDGSDDNTGTKTAPFATLQKALEVVGAGGGVIWVRGGIYEFSEAVVISTANSGTSTTPLFIKAYEDETPVFTTYKSLKTEWFTEMRPDDPMADRLDSSLNFWDIYTVSLADYGYTKDDLTKLVNGGDAFSRQGTTYEEDYAAYKKALAEDPYTSVKEPQYIDYRYSAYGVKPFLLIGDTEYELCRYPNADEAPLSYAQAYEMGRVTSSTGSEIYYDWIGRCNEVNMDPYTPIPWEITLGTRNSTQRNAGVKCEDTADWDRYAPILDWIDTGNIWFFGRPYSDWDVAQCNVHVGKQVNANGALTGEVAHFSLGSKDDYAIVSTTPVGLGARSTSSAGYQHDFYLFNAFEAIDIPGEWFIDEESEDLRLYIYPTDDFFEEEDISYTGSYNGSIISMPGNVSNVVIDGITFSGTGANGIHRSGNAATKMENVVIENCTFKHTANGGVTIGGGILNHVAVIYNDFSQSNGHMLSLANNQSYNLIPDHNVIQNNTFHDPSPNHQVGISFQGCRTVVSHNFLLNTNINLGGPCYESIVEYNRLVGGSEDVGDGGQVYMYGLYTRGNHIRCNVMHGLNFSGNNIYNDGMCSGNYSYYNVCSTLTGYRPSGQKCFYVSTGHNNVSFNNIFITRSHERTIANLEAHGTTPSNTGFEYFNPVTGKKEKISRPIGDSVMYESTLFYADKKDPGYQTSRGGEDAASYSWDDLYRAAAGTYTGVRPRAYIDLEMMEKRFPNWMAAMRGAQELFDRMDEMDTAAALGQGPGYDRRTDVLAMEAAYDAKVAELMAEGMTKAQANNEAFRLGLAYNEDFYRQPAYNLYKNNVLIGGDIDYYFDTDSDGIYGEERADLVYSDYLANRAGLDDFGFPLASGNDPFAKDLRIIETNYYHTDYTEIFWDADPDYRDGWRYYADYSFLDGVEEEILSVIPEYYDLLDISIVAGLSDQ